MRSKSSQIFFTSAQLIITLTCVFLFTEPSFSVPKCSEVLKVQETTDDYPKNLPNTTKIFWGEIGSELQRTLDFDFQRSANKKIYATHIKMNHPEVAFYKSLGFELTPDGTFKTPSAKILFSRLQFQVTQLNRNLKEMGADFQINPKLFLDLKSEEFDQQQRVVLDLFQDFSAPGHKLVAKSNILKTLPFYKFVGNGGFPIGGTESASGLSRVMVEVAKTSIDPAQKADLDSKANISDFLHDLAHLSAFLRNPKFAAAYVRVFRSKYNKLQKMDPEQRKLYQKELETAGTKEWRRIFYFSESAWLVHANYQTKINKYPILSSILKDGNSYHSDHLSKYIGHVDKVALIKELENLKADWWGLFDPMGGAVNDMISLDAFSPNVRSNFIVQRVLRELESYLASDRPLENANQSSLTIILGFLKNSPRMTVTSWEYFARSEDWKSSEIFRALQDIFPVQESNNMPEWKILFDFLYK